MLIGIIVLGIGLSIGITNPVYDYWYYGMAIFCLIGMLANMVSMINYLNYLTTRPVPDFFKRRARIMGNKKRRVAIILITFMLVFNSPNSVFADAEAVIKHTANNGNIVVIDDSAELLSEGEKERLLENMKT